MNQCIFNIIFLHPILVTQVILKTDLLNCYHVVRHYEMVNIPPTKLVYVYYILFLTSHNINTNQLQTEDSTFRESVRQSQFMAPPGSWHPLVHGTPWFMAPLVHGTPWFMAPPGSYHPLECSISLCLTSFASETSSSRKWLLT